VTPGSLGPAAGSSTSGAASKPPSRTSVKRLGGAAFSDAGPTTSVRPHRPSGGGSKNVVTALRRR
jgi:hypothetical protein